MRYIIAILIGSIYLSNHCWTHTFRNNSTSRINIATKRRPANYGGTGETICHVVLDAGQSTSCEAGGKCPEIVEISKVSSSRKSTYNINSWNLCQHFDFTISTQTNPAAAQEFVLEQRGHVI